jgi:hypothetical protein
VDKVARLLTNAAALPSPVLRRRFGRLLERIRRAAAREQQTVREQLEHFLKVTASYRPGLFVCYERAGVPRTNNDLEHLFGSHRYHERRARGRKQGSPGLVVRGAVRVVTAWATRLQPDQVLELSPATLDQWRQQRAALAAAGGQAATATLPPRSGGLPQLIGTRATPVKFADLGFLRRGSNQGNIFEGVRAAEEAWTP